MKCKKCEYINGIMEALPSNSRFSKEDIKFHLEMLHEYVK